LLENIKGNSLGNKWGQINGDRPHFARKRTFSYRKWGQAPFIRYIKKEENKAVLLLNTKMLSGDYFFFK